MGLAVEQLTKPGCWQVVRRAGRSWQMLEGVCVQLEEVGRRLAEKEVKKQPGSV